MQTVRVCFEHRYLNTSSKALFCPVGGERLLVRNLAGREIITLREEGKKQFGVMMIEREEVSLINYPRNFSVISGEKIKQEVTQWAMRK